MRRIAVYLAVLSGYCAFAGTQVQAQGMCQGPARGTVQACGTGTGYFRPQGYTANRYFVPQRAAPGSYYAPLGRKELATIQHTIRIRSG